ncbi:unnamed protein product [Protopolystoma xenopodis]|uniref:Uncharacterized protein n=1 Tax=Protopolystoma xenopodis TaxID=117903 RepID=A0A448XIC5_9PLAT|nr:unnamed protein product [Protopolystoma xenopodis]
MVHLSPPPPLPTTPSARPAPAPPVPPPHPRRRRRPRQQTYSRLDTLQSPLLCILTPSRRICSRPRRLWPVVRPRTCRQVHEPRGCRPTPSVGRHGRPTGRSRLTCLIAGTCVTALDTWRRKSNRLSCTCVFFFSLLIRYQHHH